MKNLRIEMLTTDSVPNTVELVMEGELTLRDVEAAREQIKEGFRYQQVKITLRHITNLDLAFIQLLAAARNTASMLHRQLTVEANLPDELQTIVKNAGFDPSLIISCWATIK